MRKRGGGRKKGGGRKSEEEEGRDEEVVGEEEEEEEREEEEGRARRRKGLAAAGGGGGGEEGVLRLGDAGPGRPTGPADWGTGMVSAGRPNPIKTEKEKVCRPNRKNLCMMYIYILSLLYTVVPGAGEELCENCMVKLFSRTV